MHSVRRLNMSDGSGWGVRVDWTAGSRHMILECYSIQAPLRVPNAVYHAVYLGNWPVCECNRCHWPRATVYLDFGLSRGRLFVAERVQVSEHEVLVKSPEQQFTIREQPDTKAFYTLAQRVRKEKDGGELLVTVFEKMFAAVPSITTCLAFRPSGPPPHADPAK